MNGSAFWDFSLAFYDRPGVPAACLALQDEYGLDVSLALFALWCATRGSLLSPDALAHVEAGVTRFRDTVLRPLRAARRALKPPPPPIDPAPAEVLRRTLLAAELEAERLQQLAMAEAAPPPGQGAAASTAQANLASLARHAGIPPDAAPLRTLAEAFG